MENWLTDYRRRVGEIGARAAGLRTELATMQASATSPDGAATATVAADGALAALVLGERATGYSRAQLAAAVLAAARAAHEQVRREVAEASAAALGVPR